MKTAVVTGGLGFIGSYFTEHLLAQGYFVYVIDNLQNNAVKPDFFKDYPKCQVYCSSIRDFNFKQLTRQIDEVYHFASILGPVGVLQFGGNIGYEILSDTIKLRDFCILYKSKLIYISSSEIYGQTADFSEEGLKVFPKIYQVRTEYGGAKMLSEMCLINKAKFCNFTYQIVRPFNVTGPRQKPDGGFVLPRFVIAALSNQAITVYGDGSQIRSFTHVNDIVKAIYQISQSILNNEIWNIGNPANKMTIADMANLVVKRVKKYNSSLKPVVKFVDPVKIHGTYFAEAADKIPNINKISTQLKFNNQFNLKVIIDEVIAYYAKKIRSGYKFKIT